MDDLQSDGRTDMRAEGKYNQAKAEPRGELWKSRFSSRGECVGKSLAFWRNGPRRAWRLAVGILRSLGNFCIIIIENRLHLAAASV